MRCKVTTFFQVLLLSVTIAFAQQQSAPAGLRLPAVFGDNMVLQRGMPVPVWGWADPGEQITVTFRQQKRTATAAQDGRWMLKLDSLEPGGPFELSVAGKQAITFKNVLVGDVWICSGQSNMEWILKNTNDAQEEIERSTNPHLRHFAVKKAVADAPQTDCTGSWQECNPNTSPTFTAVGYYFGRKLQKDLGVPIGLIHTSWGGTAIEPWTSVKAMEADPEIKAAVLDAWSARVKQYEADLKKWEEAAAAAKREGKPVPRKPGLPMAPGALYNAMIAPLIPYAITGAIWYQGESNAGRAILYRKQLPLMIKNWRDDWGQGEFPFLIVSLANFMARKDQPSDSAWAELREAQAMTAASVPKAGLAITIDVGDAKDIHPRDKKTVGERLALAALAIAYGKNIVYSGPVFESMKIEGSSVRLTFKHVGSGLVAKGESLKGFAVAGQDRQFHWADARIEGNNTVVLSCKDVPQPVAVRYAWADNPECNLYNKEGLPAVPFRTDDWPRQPAQPAK